MLIWKPRKPRSHHIVLNKLCTLDNDFNFVLFQRVLGDMTQSITGIIPVV